MWKINFHFIHSNNFGRLYNKKGIYKFQWNQGVQILQKTKIEVTILAQIMFNNFFFIHFRIVRSLVEYGDEKWTESRRIPWWDYALDHFRFLGGFNPWSPGPYGRPVRIFAHT